MENIPVNPSLELGNLLLEICRRLDLLESDICVHEEKLDIMDDYEGYLDDKIDKLAYLRKRVVKLEQRIAKLEQQTCTVNVLVEKK